MPTTRHAAFGKHKDKRLLEGQRSSGSSAPLSNSKQAYLNEKTRPGHIHVGSLKNSN